MEIDLLNGILFLASMPLLVFAVKYLIDTDKIKSYHALIVITVTIFSVMFILHLLVTYYFGMNGGIMYTVLIISLSLSIVLNGKKEVYKS